MTVSTFQRAIQRNEHLFRDKVVLDVGCGLGILSLLALKAGARKVVATEQHGELISMASRIALANGFGPDVITFLTGRPSDLTLPDGLQEVDIIVSNFVGYFLMYESRVADVLSARDRWLRPQGLLFPDRCSIHIAMVEDNAYKERHFDYYHSVWGFDFSAMREKAHSEPVVSVFDPTQLLSGSACVLDLDLYSCSANDFFGLATKFQVVAKRTGAINAILSWFEVRFNSCHKPLFFSTSPAATPTCWKQTAFFLEPVQVKANDVIKGMVAVRKLYEHRRHLDIKFSCKVNRGVPHVSHFRWT